jgi:hypothetical protein
MLRRCARRSDVRKCCACCCGPAVGRIKRDEGDGIGGDSLSEECRHKGHHKMIGPQGVSLWGLCRDREQDRKRMREHNIVKSGDRVGACRRAG